MENTDYLYKTKPNCAFMIFMIAGAGFFIFLSRMALPVRGSHIAASIFLIIFGLFALTSLSLAAGFKIYYITQTAIIITIPVIFYKRVIPLGDIKSLSDHDVKIDFDPKSFVVNKTSIGNKVIVLLNDGRKIQLSSLQIGKYHDFRKTLRSVFINYNRKAH